LEIWEASVPTPFPFTDHGEISHTKADPPMYTCVPNFIWIVFSCQQKSQILQHYQFRHPVVAPSSNVETKLNVAAQLQTFPIQRYQKSLLSSNGFLAKSFSQTLPFKSVKDKQTKQKTTVLVPPAACEV